MRVETDRLVLRSWEERDRAPLATVLGDPEVRRFYAKTLTAEQSGEQLDRAIARQAETGYHFGAAELKSNGRFVGLIGLGHIDEPLRSALPGHPAVEIGWQFDKAFWGQGLAPEGARALLEYGFGFLELEEIVAFTYVGNTPSQRVMQKIGMVEAGHFEHPALAEGHPLRSHVLYRIARPLTA